MKLGICVPHYGRPIEIERMLAVVQRAEEGGLDSVWVTDHVIVPQDVDVIYREDMLDPLAVLPWLAAATSRVSLGTSVVILPYRTPIPVAKLLASVDVLSGGRLIVGVAIGWMEGEFAALGVPFKERVSRSEEAIALMKQLWTEEMPDVKTARHRFSGLQVSPMPLRKPRPPIWVGGMSEPALRRAARLGDGWHATGATPETFRQAKQSLMRFWKEEGREGQPALSLRIALFIDGVHEWAVDQKLLRGRHPIKGTIKQVAGQLAEYQRLGVDHVALEVSYSTYPAIMETIDIVAEEIKPLLGRG